MGTKNIRNSKFFPKTLVLPAMIFIGLALVCIGGFLAKDWYLNPATKLTCLKPMQSFWAHAAHGNLYINNVLCMETTDSASQIYMFYKQRGWYCDGACEYEKDLDLGLFEISIYKIAKYSQTTPIKISLAEEYGIGGTGP
jgi:hypothetical protein